MFNQLGIRAKIILAFMVAALIPVAVGVVSYHYSSKVISTYKTIATDNVPNLKLFIDMKGVIVGSQIPVASIVGTASTPDDAAQASVEFEEYMTNFEKLEKDYLSTPFADGEEPFWREYKSKAFDPYVKMSRELIKLSGTNNKADQKIRDQIYKNEYADLIKRRTESFIKVVGFQTNDTAQRQKSGDASKEEMNTIIFSLVLLGFLVAISFGYLISVFLSRELFSVAKILNERTEQVSSAVTQLAGAAEELSSSSVEQAASVQETAASVEEISAMVNKNASNASECEKFSSSSKEKAEMGKKAVERMIHSMGEISRSNETIESQIQESNRKLGEVIHVIQEIGNKTKVINDIVFQTKLLSFNASVEAARAGEHGKGFAVVAEEVGNLAQMSGNSAKEISVLLEDSLKKVEAMIAETTQAVGGSMIQSKQVVANGNKTAKYCGETLDAIVGDVKTLSDLISEISSAGREQSQGINEISKAVQQIDQATQSNSAAAQQTSSSSQSVAQQVSHIENAASRLRAIVSGGAVDVMKLDLAARAQSDSKVLPFKKKPKARMEYNPVKKAIGSDLTVPQGNDARFEDA